MKASPFVRELSGMGYVTFLGKICARLEARSYLEIGVFAGASLAAISCDAIGVDPAFRLTVDPTVGKRALHLFRMTSDAFFAEVDVKQIFPSGVDLVFIDGMHLVEAVLRDFLNAERACHAGSVILVHDCFPPAAEVAERRHHPAARTIGPFRDYWTGDVWKLLPILRRYRPELGLTSIDCAPTGMLCVTGLQPGSTVLGDRYEEIVAEFPGLDLDDARLADHFAEASLVGADDFLAGRQPIRSP